ncbi:MAG: hypothetical protein RIC03_16235 [Cyclobacteriaceae bacterium]
MKKIELITKTLVAVYLLLSVVSCLDTDKEPGIEENQNLLDNANIESKAPITPTEKGQVSITGGLKTGRFDQFAINDQGDLINLAVSAIYSISNRHLEDPTDYATRFKFNKISSNLTLSENLIEIPVTDQEIIPQEVLTDKMAYAGVLRKSITGKMIVDHEGMYFFDPLSLQYISYLSESKKDFGLLWNNISTAQHSFIEESEGTYLYFGTSNADLKRSRVHQMKAMPDGSLQPQWMLSASLGQTWHQMSDQTSAYIYDIIPRDDGSYFLVGEIHLGKYAVEDAGTQSGSLTYNIIEPYVALVDEAQDIIWQKKMAFLPSKNRSNDRLQKVVRTPSGEFLLFGATGANQEADASFSGLELYSILMSENGNILKTTIYKGTRDGLGDAIRIIGNNSPNLAPAGNLIQRVTAFSEGIVLDTHYHQLRLSHQGELISIFTHNPDNVASYTIPLDYNTTYHIQAAGGTHTVKVMNY